MTVFTAASHPGRAGGPGCDEPLTKLKVRVGEPGQRGEPEARSRRVGGPGDPCTRGRGEQHRTDAIGGGVEPHARCATAPTSAGCTPPRARTRHAADNANPKLLPCSRAWPRTAGRVRMRACTGIHTTTFTHTSSIAFNPHPTTPPHLRPPQNNTDSAAKRSDHARWP